MSAVMDEEPTPPPGFEDWNWHRLPGGVIRWMPPRPQMPPRHAFLVFPHRRRLQWIMIGWLAFVLFCFLMAWVTR